MPDIELECSQSLLANENTMVYSIFGVPPNTNKDTTKMEIRDNISWFRNVSTWISEPLFIFHKQNNI